MRKAMDMVAEFHRKHGAPELDHVATAEEIEARRVLRFDLILEEAQELEEALGMNGDERGEPRTPDVVEVADALADLAYVTIGAALEWGIPLDRVFAEVHRSNMTKTVGAVRGDGKILKGEGYEPPRIGDVLAGGLRCRCTHEEGDSHCPAHPSCDYCGESFDWQGPMTDGCWYCSEECSAEAEGHDVG